MVVALSKPDDLDAYRLDPQMLSDLWVFRHAARAGSFTGAAQRLRVTQGAVSQRVIRLEGRLSTTLFSRKSGRLVLTQSGEAVLASMDQVAVLLNGTLSRFDRSQRRSVVVSCIPSLATEWLVPSLDEFYRENPDIQLFIRAEMFQPSAEFLEDENIDVLLSYSKDGVSDLHELANLPELIIPVCTRSYRQTMAAEEGPPSVTRLHDDAPCFGGPQDFEWRVWEAGHPDWRDEVVGERHFNLAHLAYHAALSDQGVAMGRSVLINRLMSRGELVAASDLPPVLAATYRVFAVRPGNARSPVRRFANWVIEALERTQRDTLAMMARQP